MFQLCFEQFWLTSYSLLPQIHRQPIKKKKLLKLKVQKRLSSMDATSVSAATIIYNLQIFIDIITAHKAGAHRKNDQLIKKYQFLSRNYDIAATSVVFLLEDHRDQFRALIFSHYWHNHSATSYRLLTSYLINKAKHVVMYAL